MHWGQIPPLVCYGALFYATVRQPSPAYRVGPAIGRSLLSLAVVLGTYSALFWLVIGTAFAMSGCREDCENAHPYPWLAAFGVLLIVITVAAAAGLHCCLWRRSRPMWLGFAIVPLAYPVLAIYVADHL
jgi:hypothetical protein